MAITISSDVDNALSALTKQTRAVLYAESGKFENGDGLSSVKLLMSGLPFGTVVRQATVSFIGTDLDFLEQPVYPALQVFVNDTKDEGNSRWEEINYGRFVVYEQEKDIEKNTTQLVAYDAMGVMAKTEYVAGDIAFPCTVASLARQIAQRFNLTVADMSKLVNYDYLISDDLYANINGITYRDILGEIAGATATIAIVSTNGELQFRKLLEIEEKITTDQDGQETTEIVRYLPIVDTLSYDQILKFSIQPKYGEINSVVLARTPEEDNIFLRDEESVAESGLTELKLANNEILDDERERFLEGLLDAVDGIYWFPFNAITEFHGFYEPGDRICILDNNNQTKEVLVTSVSLEIGASIKEELSGDALDENSTDYALAGGITKTVYNTEIKVDKQKRQIESIVSEQSSFNNRVNETFSNIRQTIDGIEQTVQKSGGSNLIVNSVGYFKNADGTPSSWDSSIGEGGHIGIMTDSDSITAGAVSGNVIELVGSTITQKVRVEANAMYALGIRVKKTLGIGSGMITVTDDKTTWRIALTDQDGANYDQRSLIFTPQTSSITITIRGSLDSDFMITDLMLAPGNTTSPWQQANGEYANTQVNISTEGVSVLSNTANGTYVKMTPFGIRGYTNNSASYSLTEDEMSSDKATINSRVNLGRLKIEVQSDGWAITRKER